MYDFSALLPMIKTICTYLVLPLAVAFIKSELLALDNSTQANGLTHWYKLAKQALAVVPAGNIETIEDYVEKVAPEMKPIIEAFDPKHEGQVAP